MNALVGSYHCQPGARQTRHHEISRSSPTSRSDASSWKPTLRNRPRCVTRVRGSSWRGRRPLHRPNWRSLGVACSFVGVHVRAGGPEAGRRGRLTPSFVFPRTPAADDGEFYVPSTATPLRLKQYDFLPDRALATSVPRAAAPGLAVRPIAAHANDYAVAEVRARGDAPPPCAPPRRLCRRRPGRAPRGRGGGSRTSTSAASASAAPLPAGRRCCSCECRMYVSLSDNPSRAAAARGARADSPPRRRSAARASPPVWTMDPPPPPPPPRALPLAAPARRPPSTRVAAVLVLEQDAASGEVPHRALAAGGAVHVRRRRCPPPRRRLHLPPPPPPPSSSSSSRPASRRRRLRRSRARRRRAAAVGACAPAVERVRGVAHELRPPRRRRRRRHGAGS